MRVPPEHVHLGRLRVANQRLVGSTWKTPADAARGMLAMQGQDFASAKWSLGLRVPGATDADVEAALADGSVVRSWPVRGTLHVTASEDLPWMLDLLGPGVFASTAARRAALAVDDRAIEDARAIAHRELAGRTVLTRDELQARFDAGGVSTDGQRGYHLLFHLSITKSLCFGPPRGKDQTFVLLSEWVRKPRALGREEALGELARRYFASHGPATTSDFSGWSKLAAKDLKAALGAARPHLAELTVGGTLHYLAADAEDVLANANVSTPSVVLLPGFDEYVLGYKDRGTVLRPERFEAVVPGGNGVFMPTLVIDGQVRGTWRRVRKTRETVIEVLPWDRLTKREAQAVSRAGADYGRFVGSTVKITVT